MGPWFCQATLAELMTDNAFHPAYFETVFTGALAAGELPAAFAIITAYAPTGQIWSDEQNRLADGRLKIRLAQWPCWRITGQTPDGSHAEPGWAVECDQATALVIGREFKQDAIYWVSQDDLVILDSSGHRAPVLAGGIRSRYRQLNSTDLHGAPTFVTSDLCSRFVREAALQFDSSAYLFEGEGGDSVYHSWRFTYALLRSTTQGVWALEETELSFPDDDDDDQVPEATSRIVALVVDPKLDAMHAVGVLLKLWMQATSRRIDGVLDYSALGKQIVGKFGL